MTTTLAEEKDSQKASYLHPVEQMGIMTLHELSQYGCTNPNRRMVSLLGKVYDVTDDPMQFYHVKKHYRTTSGSALYDLFSWTSTRRGLKAFGEYFTGHDITIAAPLVKFGYCRGRQKRNEEILKWVNCFVKISRSPLQLKQLLKEMVDNHDRIYPVCGKLEKWGEEESGMVASWPEMEATELDEYRAQVWSVVWKRIRAVVLSPIVLAAFYRFTLLMAPHDDTLSDWAFGSLLCLAVAALVLSPLVLWFQLWCTFPGRLVLAFYILRHCPCCRPKKMQGDDELEFRFLDKKHHDELSSIYGKEGVVC